MTGAVAIAELSGGRTRCTTLRSSPPISFRDTADGLHLVGSGAGPVGGDDLRIDVEVGAAASLVVRSVAASMVFPGPSAAPSALRVQVRVAAAASLIWEPEPTILVAGCDHRSITRIHLAAGASLVWREVVVLGRHDEASGSLLQRLHVDRDGAPLLRTELPLGPRWPGAEGPAGTDGARVVTSVVVVGLDAPQLPDAADGAVLQLQDDAWLLTSVEGGPDRTGGPSTSDRTAAAEPPSRRAARP